MSLTADETPDTTLCDGCAKNEIPIPYPDEIVVDGLGLCAECRELVEHGHDVPLAPFY